MEAELSMYCWIFTFSHLQLQPVLPSVWLIVCCGGLVDTTAPSLRLLARLCTVLCLRPFYRFFASDPSCWFFASDVFLITHATHHTCSWPLLAGGLPAKGGCRAATASTRLDADQLTVGSNGPFGIKQTGHPNSTRDSLARRKSLGMGIAAPACFPLRLVTSTADHSRALPVLKR